MVYFDTSVLAAYYCPEALSFSSDAELVTADGELAKAARHFGVRTQFLS